MPIRPENRARYPKDWKAISAEVRQRAQQRCQTCGVHNGAWGWRDREGTFHEVRKGPLIDARKHLHGGRVKPPFTIASDKGELRIIEIVLTVAHLDHTPENCDPSNLRALCQRCHLTYDAKHHAQTAYRTRKNNGTKELPL